MTTICYISYVEHVIHAIAKNVVHNGVIMLSTLNVNISRLMTHTVARISCLLGVGSSVYCDATDKNKFEASGL
jgi:2-polyprenyl-3-methyl-5-hydroxy-6-metoxy-1,4-benzoquinol methylase